MQYLSASPHGTAISLKTALASVRIGVSCPQRNCATVHDGQPHPGATASGCIVGIPSARNPQAVTGVPCGHRSAASAAARSSSTVSAMMSPFYLTYLAVALIRNAPETHPENIPALGTKEGVVALYTRWATTPCTRPSKPRLLPLGNRWQHMATTYPLTLRP